MPAYIKNQPLPDGSPQFVFCTEKAGGHGDLIGGVDQLKDLARSAILQLSLVDPEGTERLLLGNLELFRQRTA